MTPESADDARFDLARSVAREAGTRALGHFAEVRALQVEEKLNGQDVVTAADRDVEELIRMRIAAAFPDDGFLGEESGLTTGTSGALWVVDPIDGTSCFIHGMRTWCISIALMVDGEAVLGVIHDPCADELFAGRRGHGAFLNGAPIRVDGQAEVTTGLIGLGANSRTPASTPARFVQGLLEAGGMFIRNGSGALMLAYVACGRLSAYYEPHINAWDCMAGLCLIREAGGWTADYPGEADLLDGAPVIAAAPQLRAGLLRLIDEASDEEQA